MDKHQFMQLNWEKKFIYEVPLPAWIDCGGGGCSAMQTHFIVLFFFKLKKQLLYFIPAFIL